MKSVLAIAAVALIAATYSLPVEESSWSAQDDLLARVYSPETQLYDRVGHSEGEATTQTDAAATAETQEAEWAKVEADKTEKAAGLAKTQEDLKAKAEADNAAAATKLASDATASAEKVTKSGAATEAAEAKHAAAEKAYEEFMASLTAEGKTADEASEKTLATYESEMAELAKAISDEKANGEAIAERQTKNAQELTTKQDKITSDYQAAAADLKTKADAMEEQFTKDKTAHNEKYAKEFKSNDDKEVAKKAELKAEKELNDKKAAEEFANIKEIDEKKVAAYDSANEAWQKTTDANAAALAAARTASSEATTKKAAAAEAHYQGVMDGVHKLEADAKEAETKSQESEKRSKAEAAAEDKEVADQAAADNTAEECAVDGSECEEAAPASASECARPEKFAAGKPCCKTIDHEHGPWMGADYVSCSMDPEDSEEDEDEENALAAAGIGAAPTLAPIPPPSAECTEKMGKLEPYVLASFKAYQDCVDAHTGNCPCPMDFACHPPADITRPEMKKALTDAFDALGACPKVCFPGTATSDGDAADTHGVCIPGADWKMLGQQISSLPVYQPSGTVSDYNPEGRFEAGESTKLCTMINSFAEGFGAVLATNAAEGDWQAAKMAKQPQDLANYGKGN